MNRDLWLLYHPADCRLGYSTAQLRTLLGDQWPFFMEFMHARGFTSEQLPTGEVVAVVYTDDVFRFLTSLPAPPSSLLIPPLPSPILDADGTRGRTGMNPAETAIAEAQVAEVMLPVNVDAADADVAGAETRRPRTRRVQLSDVIPILATGAAALLLGRALLRALGL